MRKVCVGDLLVYRDWEKTDPPQSLGGKWGSTCLVLGLEPSSGDETIMMAEYLDTEGNVCFCEVKDLRFLNENRRSCEG